MAVVKLRINNHYLITHECQFYMIWQTIELHIFVKI